jgi:hypothetical protein
MRAGGLTGFQHQHQAGDIFLGDLSATLIADEVQPIFLHHLHQAAAALGVEVAVEEEGKGQRAMVAD